ncbi:unnamed protein product [Rotaria socialis]
MNLNVSKSTISRIANEVGKQRQLCLLNSEKPKFHRRRHTATPSIVRRITSYINQENSQTVSLMAARSVHRFYPAITEKRPSRAWRMYRRLSNEKNKNYLTTDEAWFYLDASQGTRDIYYVRSNQLPAEIKKIEQNDLHPVAVMLWAGVSSHGKTQVYFIEHGATITSKYYIEHIIHCKQKVFYGTKKGSERGRTVRSFFGFVEKRFRMERLFGKWKKKVSYTWFRIKLSESYSSDEGPLGSDV